MLRHASNYILPRSFLLSSLTNTKRVASMSTLSSIESATLRMPSGYDIPRVGFGVYQT